MCMDTKSTSIVGLVILVVIILGGAFWYMSEHPAPITFKRGGTGVATSTEAGPPQKIEEHAQYYDIEAQTPSKTALAASADATAVTLMRQFVLSHIEGFKERGNFSNLTTQDLETLPYRDGRKQQLDISYEIKQGPRTISYVFVMYEDTFGAHGNAYYRTFTFDKASGEGMHLDEIFTGETNFYETLSRESRKALPGVLGKIAGTDGSNVDTDYIARGTTPYADNFQNWYVEGGSLVLVFPPYQVAAYAYGAPEVRLPLSSLAGIREEFR